MPHARLVSKLEAIGFNGEILQWVRNWLAGRRQRVVLGGVSRVGER